MAKYVFKNVKDLENDLKTGIKAALKTQVGESIALKLIYNAQDIVYEGYNPKVYDHKLQDRRYSLREPDNYDIQVDENMNLAVTPVAEFNPYYYEKIQWEDENGNPHETWVQHTSRNRGNELAGLINYGTGWNGYHYDFEEKKESYADNDNGYNIEENDNDFGTFSAPRPFIDITRDELKDGLGSALLAESLKDLGYSVIYLK